MRVPDKRIEYARNRNRLHAEFLEGICYRWVALHRYLLVGGGTVEGGDGDVIEAEIDAELCCVVDEVVEAHLAEG